MSEMSREQEDVMQALANKHGSCRVTTREDGAALMVGSTRDGVEMEYVLVDVDGGRTAAEHLRPGKIHANPGNNVVSINGVRVPGSISGGGEA